jgi:Matrixin
MKTTFIGVFASLGFFSVLLGAPKPAHAFCRATGCLSEPEAICSYDANGCIFEGVPLGWSPGTKLTVELETDGLDQDAGEGLRSSLSRAIDSWLNVRCGEDGALGFGGSPGEGGAGGAGGESAETTPEPPAGGSAPYLQIKLVESAGAIVIRPRTGSDWPYEPNVAAKTTLEFGLTSGTITGAVLELNFANFRFVENPRESDELSSDAVLTHEMGHVLGLDHTRTRGATMEAETSSSYSEHLSSLELDDSEAICAIYPPLETEPPEDVDIDLSDDVVLRDEGASCQLSPSGKRTPGAEWLFLIAGCAGLFVRRRRGGTEALTA